MKKISTIFIAVLALASCQKEAGDLKTHALFSDNAVLQQNSQVPIWGWANPGSKIALSADWGETAKTTTDNSGKWEAILKTPAAGGPFNIKIQAIDTAISLKNILVGEVWLASGQSNMQMPLKGWIPALLDAEKEVAQANNPNIRMFTVETTASYDQSTDVTGNWDETTPENATGFSAAAYFFARKLNKELNIPVGIIHSSWGGTPIESWAAVDFLKNVKGYEKKAESLVALKENLDDYNKWLKPVKYIDLDSIDKKNPYTALNLEDDFYKEADFDDANWKEMNAPELWDDQEIGRFDGVVWYRKTFEMPEKIEAGDYDFFLGMVNDMDNTYINGIELGKHLGEGYWNYEREYTIAANMLKPGKNVIAVRVIDSRGEGGIYGEKDITISKGDKVVANLTGKWKYKPTALISVSDMYVFGDDHQTNYESMPKMPFPLSSHTPTHLFNGMIAPLIPYAIKGAIWYQGESNVGRAEEYKASFPALIKGWRAKWNIGNFPFYYVQIAPFNYNETNFATPELRNAQFLTLKEENVGMAVITDIGDTENIHPANKQEVGERLALWALAKNYGQDSVCYSGPIYQNTEVLGNKITVSFSNTGKGLVCKGKELNYFEIAGADTVFYAAKAQIIGDKVEVKSEKVANPKFVRFGWLDTAEPNLFNEAGLPASPFRN